MPLTEINRRPKEKSWATKYFLKLIRKCQCAWHSKDVLLNKKLRNKVQRNSKMLQEKYYEKQKLKI